MNITGHNRLIYAGLIILILFQVVSNFFWLQEDYYIPRHDENQYFAKSVNTLRLIQDPSRLTLKNLLEVKPKNRPHLFPMSAWPFFFFRGISYDSACLANSGFLIILILATFGIGNSFGKPGRGLLAACITSFRSEARRVGKECRSWWSRYH